MGRKIDIEEFARSGGKKTVELYGSEHMGKIAAKGRKNIKNKKQYYKKLSLAGVHAREVKKQAFIKANIVDDSSIGKFSRLLNG